MSCEAVLEAASLAKAAGATRFCMGAAWRSPKARDLEKLLPMIQGVKAMGLETCATLGLLDALQAEALKAAGLDYYNHNLDSSEEFYPEIITTRRWSDRLDTLEAVRGAGLHVCCGGIVGMGESRRDRASLLTTLATLPKHPESVPINLLVQVEGTPLAHKGKGRKNEREEGPYARVSPFEFVRTIAVARILMPASYVRLSAGREEMSEEMQALCFLSGANSIFYGDKLLTTSNPGANKDQRLLDVLGMRPAMPAIRLQEAHDAAA
jgi:biotin synthase